MEIGKIKKLPLREVWAHEALDFTAWLAENIDVIDDAIGLTLTSVEREQAAGSFRVDLIAEEFPSSRRVVIENQLERSDHDHLGKLITYSTIYEASIAIWIVPEAREEHKAAVSWLNRTMDVDFYLLQAEALSIDSSKPALLLTKLIGPSLEIKSIEQNRSELNQQRLDFFKDLLQETNKKTSLFKNISPSEDSWIAASSGRSGFNFYYSIKAHSWNVGLWIETSDKQSNKKFFDELYDSRISMNPNIQHRIDWERKSELKRCSIEIKSPRHASGYLDQSNWSNIHNEMASAMISLSKELQNLIKELPNGYPSETV